MKRLIVDLDGTLTLEDSKDYAQVSVCHEMREKLKEYKAMGFEIVIATARNMRTYEGNVGKINVHTLPVILKWLEDNDVPYDEVIVGKPWCGYDGFYIDDKAVRPSEFTSLSYAQITALLEKEKQ